MDYANYENPILEDLVNYTPEEQAVLDKITADTICTGGPGILAVGIRLGGHPSKWSTLEGLKQQIDNFKYVSGILYYFKIENGKLRILSTIWRK
jgi:hypothetical protein